MLAFTKNRTVLFINQQYNKLNRRTCTTIVNAQLRRQQQYKHSSYRKASSAQLIRYCTITVPLLVSSILFNHHWTHQATAVSAMMMSSATNNIRRPKVIDSHLHVWGTLLESSNQQYPYEQVPPVPLQDCATVSSLLQYMDHASIDGALIVQPINYLYDHSYVLNAIKSYPKQFKGMMLYDPTINNEESAMHRLEELVLAGFVGIRFNPYLYLPQQQVTNNDKEKASAFTATGTNAPIRQLMSEGISMKIYQRCGALQIPVGIMCFQGLHLHYQDIVQLVETSPETMVILDHFAFTKFRESDDDNPIDTDNFQLLLNLSKYPCVHVKISALFRMNDIKNPQYQRIYTERFVPLLEAYGAQRLLYGSDFPYILETKNDNDEQPYTNTCQLVASWCPDVETRNAIMGGTAERLFGPWGDA